MEMRPLTEREAMQETAEPRVLGRVVMIRPIYHRGAEVKVHCLKHMAFHNDTTSQLRTSPLPRAREQENAIVNVRLFVLNWA